MNEINCMIVDDEPLARQIIQTYIARVPGWKLVKSCMNAVEAYEGLHQYAVDILLLDIQMPVVSGIEFLRSLKQAPQVIFTTAYAEHAVAAFELNAVDYLVKPVTYERFLQAVEKSRERLSTRTSQTALLSPPDYCFIKQDARLVRVNYRDILYMEARRDFTMLHCKDKKLLASMHLKALENMLLPAYIQRVHRSYIVNIDSIKAIEGNTIEIGGASIPIGANYKKELFTALGI